MIRDGELSCPRCRGNTSAKEWRLIFRRVVSADGKSVARVLEHRPCEQVVYFLL